MEDERSPVPYIHGARGEEYQASADAPVVSPAMQRVCFGLAAVIVAGVLAVVWLA